MRGRGGTQGGGGAKVLRKGFQEIRKSASLVSKNDGEASGSAPPPPELQRRPSSRRPAPPPPDLQRRPTSGRLATPPPEEQQVEEEQPRQEEEHPRQEEEVLMHPEFYVSAGRWVIVRWFVQVGVRGG